MRLPFQPGSTYPAVEWMSSPSRPSELLPFDAPDDVVGQLHPLEGLAQDELARMEDEGLVAVDRGDLREAWLLDARVDVRVAVVVEDAEVAVQVEVHRRGLQAIGIEGVDADATLLEGGADVPVGEDAHDG